MILTLSGLVCLPVVSRSKNTIGFSNIINLNIQYLYVLFLSYTIPENNIKTLISSSYKIITNQDVDSYIPEIKGEIVAIKDRLGNIESGITEIKDEYAKSDDIPILTGYATEEWVEGQGYLTEHQSLDGYATEQWVEDKHYLTSHQSLDGYAKKNEIPSVEGLASESWVESQGYLTEHQDISGKADKTELQNYVKTTVIRNYLKKSDMPDRNDIALVSELPTLLDDYAYLLQWEHLSML